MRMIEILGERRARATFFVLGWVAERRPQLVRAITAAGHEVASHGYGHELVYKLDHAQFRTDVLRSRLMLEDISGTPVRGYRAPCFSITNWAVPILEEAGYSYDSSVVPTLAHDRYGRLEGNDLSKTILTLRAGFHEVCVSCLKLGRRGIPWGGGGYFRLIPYSVWLRGVATIRQTGQPYVFYIHPWEIDPGQPEVNGIGAANRFRQRVNLARCETRFSALAGAFPTTTVGGMLDAWLKCTGNRARSEVAPQTIRKSA